MLTSDYGPEWSLSRHLPQRFLLLDATPLSERAVAGPNELYELKLNAGRRMQILI
jgi:hypothetical protein